MGAQRPRPGFGVEITAMQHSPNGRSKVIALGPEEGPGVCRERLSETLAAGSSRVVIDLSAVGSIDDAMVSTLTSALRICSLRAGRLVLVHRSGFRALRAGGLGKLFDIAPTRERALAMVSESAKPPRAATGASARQLLRTC